MARHRLRIDYDEDTGELSVTHRTTARVGNHAVTWSEPVAMADPAATAAALKGLLDANREEMETRASEAAVEHVAAVSGIKRRGRKQQRLEGAMGAIGEVKP